MSFCASRARHHCFKMLLWILSLHTTIHSCRCFVIARCSGVI